MKTDQQNLKLIAAYLSGELSDRERNDLKTWIKAAPENERVFKEASRIWENSSVKLSVSHFDSDVLWQELKLKMDHAGQSGVLVSFYHRYKTILQIAASAIILLAAVVYFVPRKSKPLNDQVAVADDIVFNSGDQVAHFYLPDSSVVWLNRKSRVSYPRAFRKARRVKLEGEGYFEVRQDTTNLFTVTTQSAQAQVIGTSFNMKEEGEQTILTVMTGAVKFTDLNTGKFVTIKAKEKARRSDGGVLEKSVNKDAAISHWRRSNNPTFENERNNPKNYLSTTHRSSKHTLNRTLISGTIKNTAHLADYSNIVLKITYTKGRGKEVTLREKIAGPVMAGGTIAYQKRLHDLFAHTRNIKVEIESASVVSPH